MAANSDDSEELDMDKIIDGLYVGGIEPTKDFDYLKEKGITHILTLHIAPLSAQHHQKFTCKFFCRHDMPSTDLLSDFEECFQFIDKGRENGIVLVHCMAGASRSATIVIAYLMHKQDIGVRESLSLVKQARPFVDPNNGFMEQLKLFQEMGCCIDKTNNKYKQYRLEKISVLMQHGKIGEAANIIPDFLSENPQNTSASNQEEIFKCRKCRKPLFKKQGLVLHIKGEGDAAFDWRASLPLSQKQEGTHEFEASEHNQCHKSLFIEPVQWMAKSILVPEGKLSCWKCGTKLGSFVWHGQRCPCGRWIAPAFHIQMCKVDQCISHGNLPTISAIGATTEKGSV